MLCSFVDTRTRHRRAATAVLVMSVATVVLADVPFRARFEDGNAKGWRTWQSDVSLAVVPREENGEDRGTCLSVSGKKLYVSAVADLPRGIPLDGPVYVTADVRSLGKSGESVGLLVANRGRFTHYKTGPAGVRAKHGWARSIWRMDGFFPGEKDVLIDGLRFAQRVAGEHEHGPEGPGRHELRVDNVEIHVGAAAEKVAQECQRLGGQRVYDGPSAFLIGEADGLSIWHAPSLSKVSLHQKPPRRCGRGPSLSMARHEAESYQIVFRSDRRREGVSIRLSELESDTGETIARSAWYWHPVRYVRITARYFGIPIDQWWPEPLSWDRQFSLEPDRTQPIWVTVDVPATTAPGQYRGTVEVLEGERIVANAPVHVTVWNLCLPARPTFRTNQQLWVCAPSPMDSRPKRVVQREMMDLLARCRQFNGSGFCRLPKQTQIEFMERGQNTIKLPFVGGHRGHASRKVTKLKGAEIFTPEYEKAFVERLTSRTQFLREMGWMKYAHLYLWDEPFGDPEVYRMITWLAKLAKRFDPELKTRVAAPCNPALVGVVDIFTSGYSTPEAIAAARQQGAEIWCTGVSAFMVDLPGLEQRMMYGLKSIQKGYTGANSWGLAYWGRRNRETGEWDSIDAWNRPHRGNKNCIALYPGNTEHSRSEKAVPSISLEVNRDGIEDYEYVTMLEAKVRTLDAEGQARPLRALLDRCRAFYVDPQSLGTDRRTVDELQELRAEVARALAD